MNEDGVLRYFAKIGIRVPECYDLPTKNERYEIWSEGVEISEDTHKKILEILKEEAKKNV